MFRIIALAALGLSLAGCNTVSETWKQAGSSNAQTERAFRECKYESNFAPLHKDIVAQCMALKGYRRMHHFYVS